MRIGDQMTDFNSNFFHYLSNRIHFKNDYFFLSGDKNIDNLFNVINHKVQFFIIDNHLKKEISLCEGIDKKENFSLSESFQKEIDLSFTFDCKKEIYIFIPGNVFYGYFTLSP